MATSDRPDEDPIKNEPASPPGPDPGRTRGAVTGRTWALAIVAVIVAGVGSWLATEAILQAYEATKPARSGPYPTPQEDEQYRQISINGGTVALAATGGLLALALGLAAGASRPSIKAALSAGVLGLLLGAALEGGVARMVLWYTYKKMDLASDDMLPPILCHLAIWCIIGALAGLAFGIGIGGRLRWLRTMIGGAVAAGIAIVAYDIIGAVLMATHETHLPHAKFPESRALAQILVSLVTGIGIVVAARDPKPKKVVPVVSSQPGPES
jgi:hypothetical protein